MGVDGITLSGTSFKYSPLGGKGMIARSEDEIVFSVYHSQQKLKGVLWIKGDISRFIPSPESKEVQDIWQDPVLYLTTTEYYFFVEPAKLFGGYLK